ncbi:MAG: hypothetical protein KDD94_05330, partial [Calditrichaeota bacterium]|nr:hypothetical protein [Calditrichota bacterium]
MLHSIYLTEPDSVLFSLSNSNHGFSGSLNGERLQLINGATFHRIELKDHLKPGKNTLSLESVAPDWAVDA